MKKTIIVTLIASLTGCASWCDNSDDYQKCLSRVHTAQAVGAAIVLVGAVAVAARAAHGSGTSDYPGNCQYSWQTAADGSRCGDRAASVRPGGY